MSVPVLRIGHGNGHNKPTLVDFVRDSDADSFSCNEAHLLVRPLNRIPGYRVTVPSKDADDRRARSTSLLTLNEHTDRGALTLQVSESLAGDIEKFAPDRWLVGSMYEHPLARALGRDGIAHFGLHPDATVKDRSLDAPVVREYREALDTTRRAMKFARSQNLLPFLTGDLQVDARFDRGFGPRAQIAGPLGMQARVVHIDWVIYPHEVVPAGPVQVRQLFDHDGFTIDFRPRKEN